jgi:hypothetical protein
MEDAGGFEGRDETYHREFRPDYLEIDRSLLVCYTERLEFVLDGIDRACPKICDFRADFY